MMKLKIVLLLCVCLVIPFVSNASELSITGPKMGISGSKYVVSNHETDAIQWSSSDTSIATISPAGVLTAMGKGIVTITANVKGESISKKIMVGTPRFVLNEDKEKPDYRIIKATCIDTQTDYADFITQNNDLVTYAWGIKTNKEPLSWTYSDSPEFHLSTLEEKDNITIYLKTIDMHGYESGPSYIRISDHDIWEINTKALIFNSKGDIYNDSGRKLFYNSSSITVKLKDESRKEFSNAEWSPGYALMITDEETKKIPWHTGVYIKELFPQQEKERIISSPDNTTWTYILVLLNYNKKIIQKTPLTIMYKTNFPN